MMNAMERATAIAAMRAASGSFYANAARTRNHTFIEFCGLMNEYINACEMAHAEGIDFSDCNAHSGQQLPMTPYMIDYVNEKLDCIFTGRIALCDQRLSREAPVEKQHPGRLEIDDVGPHFNGLTKAAANAWLEQLRAPTVPEKSDVNTSAARKKASKPPVERMVRRVVPKRERL